MQGAPRRSGRGRHRNLAVRNAFSGRRDLAVDYARAGYSGISSEPGLCSAPIDRQPRTTPHLERWNVRLLSHYPRDFFSIGHGRGVRSTLPQDQPLRHMAQRHSLNVMRQAGESYLGYDRDRGVLSSAPHEHARLAAPSSGATSLEMLFR